MVQAKKYLPRILSAFRINFGRFSRCVTIIGGIKWSLEQPVRYRKKKE